MKLHPSIQSLVDDIDAFLAATGMSPTAFGLLAMNDGSFLRRLRAGERAPSLLTAERVKEFIASHQVSA